MPLSQRVAVSMAALGVCLGAAACSPPGTATDLLRATDSLAEASVAGRDRTWVVSQVGHLIRLNDVFQRTLPASPPSRLRYVLDIPSRAKLHVACGISPKRYDQPGIEFMVTVGDGAAAKRVWSQIVDPLKNAQDRRWVEATIDLSRYAGHQVPLVLETRGFSEDDDSAAAFWGAPTITAPQRAPLAIIYLVDTLRADHTSPYGYDRDTTPALTALARDGVLFEKAISQASWTKPSVASIFTSLPPSRHGVVELRDTLAGDLTTIAEMLSDRGFATSAEISNVVIYGKGTGFEQGFDVFAGLHGADDRPSKSVLAAEVVDAAIAAIDAHRGLPHFLFVHTMDPHVPYTPPAPYNTRYAPHPAPGHPGADPRTDAREPKDRDRLMAQYDGEVAYGDAEFGRLIAALKERDLYNEALIIFTSDHGEEFQDHGKWLHGRSVFDELIHVPLVVKLPGNRHASLHIGRQVQSLDILPTALDALGVPLPRQPHLDGIPLQEVMEGTAPTRVAISEVGHRGHVSYAARTEDHKYVVRYSPLDDPIFGPVRELLFDLTNDPHELTNRLAAEPAVAENLRSTLDKSIVASPYTTMLRVFGAGSYRLDLRSDGRIQSLKVEPTSKDLQVETPGPHEAHVTLTVPRRSEAVVSFVVWPRGAPAWLSGTRNRRAIGTRDVLIGDKGMTPSSIPVTILESEPERDLPTNIFAEPPKLKRSGIQIWLAPREHREVMAPWSRETCEQMQALGYADCPQP